MNKKLQVFISSTYTDLIEERQAAVEAILNAGHIPAGMELFKAGKSQMKTIQKWIDESDVYMLILGGRYGSIEEDSGLSYTELEYRYALSKNMPVFAVVLKDSFLHIKAASSNTNTIFEKYNTDKYEFFKKYVLSNIVKFAKNADQISSIIHLHLADILNDPEYKLTGWIRNSPEYNEKQLFWENISLKQEINILKEKICSIETSKFEDYNFDELINLFQDKIFKINTNDLKKVRKGSSINALDMFILYYNYFVTGVPNSIVSKEYYYLYNYIIPYFVSFRLIEKENTKSGKFHISKIGCSFYTLLESKGLTNRN